MKRTLFILSVFIGFSLNAQVCSDLFISEYVEGPGNNNAIEIYNPTSDEWSEPGQINLTIFGVNDQPVISIINDQIINEDSSGLVTFYVSDEDGPMTDSNINFYTNNENDFLYTIDTDNESDINEISFMFEPAVHSS